MSLKLSLVSLSNTDLPIETKQQALIDIVLRFLTPQERASLFESITHQRETNLLARYPEYQSKSLSVLFELMDYRDLVRLHPNNLHDDVYLLELTVAECFPHWLDFWCACEIEAIKQKYSLENREPATELSFEDASYSAMLIDDISKSSMRVQLPSYPVAMTLSDAVALSNLELFVQGEKWYEILPLLSLSQKGKHFILLQTQTTPVLVASALIQDWNQRNTWLSYAPQFNSEKWRFCLPLHGYQELNRLDILASDLVTDYGSLTVFDQAFQTHITKTETVCEVLRLTVSGSVQHKLYFLYLAQKELMNVLFQSGYKVGFTIIEQAFMLNFYQSIDSKAYFHSGYCDINGDGIYTYRGFWNFESMVDTFKRTDFRDYKRRIRVIRQNTQVNEHA
ncbi:acyl-homoserine-lactone synthase OpaM [Vibrio parahaemolyticus]|nr:acyl-homoserine-lactone synthase OpaM [Vibrio parahaemolyticus]HBC3857261.1 acyl-homoserine-lactone synthase OpaM [Vibrio parahaemolyticus]